MPNGEQLVHYYFSIFLLGYLLSKNEDFPYIPGHPDLYYLSVAPGQALLTISPVGNLQPN
jgi:hypothetical protein